MYSPKISAEYIPFLYRKAKTKRIPMTRLVNEIIAEYFMQTLPETIMEEDQESHKLSA
jgi:hypothetical protein